MASHHHYCHHPTTASYCHCYSCHHHTPPPPDCHPVFHGPPQPHLYSAQAGLPNLHQYHPHFQERSFQEERQAQHTVSSLLRRIATLEAALRRRSSSSSHSLSDAAARTIQTHFRAFVLRRSRTLRQLKELAWIKSALGALKSSISDKTHFDFEVVYDEAVDLLHKLDAIQGGDPMIRDGKSSVRKDLNKFLDFLDEFCVGRRGLSCGGNVRYVRNTVKNGVANVERKSKNTKFRSLKNGNMEKLRSLAERIDKLAEELDEEEDEVIESRDVFVKNHGSKSRGLLKRISGAQPKAKKSVTFADNGKVYKVLRRDSEPLGEDYDDGIARGDSGNSKRDLEDDLCREVDIIRVTPKEADADDDDDDDNEVEAHSENGGLLSSSDGEKELRNYTRSEGNSERNVYDDGEADGFTFSAPLPLKMETRADRIDKKKKLAK